MADRSHGWCSLRLRFDERELVLLRGAEKLKGASLAHTARPEVLRQALSLAKTGQKLGAAVPGGSVMLEESELGLLLDALHYAHEQLPYASDAENGHQRDAVLSAFPELVERGTWRSFGLGRELQALSGRLKLALEGASQG